MKGDQTKLYEEERDFYELEGNIVMKLVPGAAIAVCQSAARHGLVIARIEGGIWHNPGFEARYDCIWDGADPPIDLDAALANNMEAAEFIERQRHGHGAFILTAAPMSGWPHKLGTGKAAPN
jgi:Colicin-E5 Imm protein